MSQPIRYSLTYDFTGFQSANPNTPLPADKLEIELNNIDQTTGEIITNLGLIQRDDGKLQNKLVNFDALDDAMKALLGTPINPRGVWAASTAYKILDLVTVGNTTYIAVRDHASGTSFTVDLTAGDWQLWANPGFVDGTSFFQKFSGNGSATAFTVSQDMGTDENGLMIFINNSGWIPQDPANYTINGTALTFLAAPPNGTNNIFVFAPAKLLSQVATYAAAAGTSAAGAATSETNAGASATSAAAHDTSSATHDTNATNAAATATTQAGIATTQAGISTTGAGTATTQAGIATTQAGIATTGAATATTQAGISTAGAATSTTQAGISTTGAGTATTQAGIATTAAAAAVAAAASVPQHTFNKTTDPTANDDSGDGYSVGSIWVNTVSDTAYMAVDVTVGAAVWENLGSAAGGITTFAPNKKYSPLKMLATDGYANGNPDTAAAATHNASAGAVPSFTTAKRRSICIVTVAGTLGGAAVAKGEYLMALQNNPTTADHWAIIGDSTTAFNAAVEAAQGGPVALYGTFFLNTANPDAAINLVGDYTILNKCGFPAIYQATNNTRAALQTPRQCASAGVGVATGIDVDDEIGVTLQSVTYFQLVTPADAANFPLNTMVEVFTDAVHVSESGSSKGYVSNAFRVTSVDLVGGIVYADRVIKYHNKIANAANIYIIPLHEDRAIKVRKGALFQGAPTIIGGEVGWWLTLDGSNPLAGTISGSGSSRTISYTGPNLEYLVNQGVRIGVVSGTPERSCKISAFSYSAGVNTITFEVSSTNDKGQAYSAPTSGTIYFVPVWWSSEFDTLTHGRALILQQAHGSEVEMEVARLWAGGCGIRFTHFSRVKVSCTKSVNIGTGISGRSWRLIYLTETYGACRNDIDVDNRGPNIGARHPYTTSSGTTSSAWAASHWQFRSGTTCENRVYIKSRGDTGPAADTHAMTNGDEITSEVEYPTSYNTAHSYRGIGAQRRCENGISRHKQRGGQVGLRIANGSYLREPGSVDYVDVEVHDLPLRAGAHAFSGEGSGNLPIGFWVQSQLAYTGGAAGSRTLTIGKLSFKNAACGFSFESNTTGRFTSIDHQDVGYALGWVQDAARVHTKDMTADYSIGGGVATVATDTVVLGAGTKTFTVATGLVIDAGIDVLVQSAASVAASKSNYGWGRVVSYNSGTGALIVFFEGIRGSGTISTWTITTGAKIPRYGVVFSGTGQFSFSTMHWKIGAGANPTEIFHSKDNTGGKTVNGGMLIIDDPLNIGMPNIVTAGREADFTVKIGVIIYNGIVMMSGGTVTTNRAAGSSYALSARDVDGAADTPFITFTANNTPTCDLSAAVTRASAPIANAVDYQEITANGNWTAPAWMTATSRVYVELGGGGGGGGGGARVAATGSGGAGGGGGNMQYRWFRGADITSPVACTIGAGGAGGAGATVDATAGGNGVAGGNTTFGTYLTAFGGGYGSGGQLATNSGGGGGGGYQGAGQNGASGAGGSAGIGGGGNGGNGVAGSSNNTGSMGGCGGSGCPVATGVGVVGGSGGWSPAGGSSGGGVLAGVFKAGGDGAQGAGYYSAAPAGGITAGAAGGNAAGLSYILQGISGGGGASNAAGAGGAAGTSAGPSAGGSGGGAAVNGANGGNGAAGRNGVIRVWVYA